MAQAGLGSASGYGSIHDTPLATKGYHSRIIERGWEKDILGEIVNTRIVAQAFDCNQVVEFILQPDVGPWRKYEDNQVIKPDTVQITSVQMTLCNQAYKAIKIDNNLQRNLCQFWSKFEAGFLDSCYRELSGMWHSFVLSAMVLEADRRNKGANAGRDRSINLGTVGAPVRVTPGNLPVNLMNLRNVLVHNSRWKNGEMFLIVPPEFNNVVIQSEYRLAADISCCKDPSMLLTGELPGQLAGFRAIESMRTISAFDQAVNKQAYYILAFWKEAFAFYGDITEGRIIEDKDYWGRQYQMAALWGGKAIYGDAIAVGYWTFE
jgi:hypothetical protein|nr:MAG TPA: major capsid protein [Caudoviricetes sp.]